MKNFFKVLMVLMLFIGLAHAGADPTSFSEALPTTLIPDGFWKMVGIVFTAVAAVWGVVKGIRLFKRA